MSISVCSSTCSFFWFRPDGQKKAYVRLAPDYDALDVANKVSGSFIGVFMRQQSTENSRAYYENFWEARWSHG